MSPPLEKQRQEHFLTHAGLTLSDAEKEELITTYVAIAGLVARLRTPRSPFAEHGHTFAAVDPA